MHTDRSWMCRRNENDRTRVEYADGVVDFLNFAFSHEECVQDEKIRCPCKKCKNKLYKMRADVQYHLHKFGFMQTYDRWVMHGEPLVASNPLNNESCNFVSEERSGIETMVMDVAGHDFNWSEQQPNREDQKFYDLLNVADEPLYDGCKTHTKLSAMARMFNLKSEYNMPESCYDRMVALVKEMLPEGDRLPQNLYKTKTELDRLGLQYEKIDSCTNNSMLYYKENIDMQECSVCHHPSYKPKKPGSQKKIPYKVLHYLPITPRLQRLYMSTHSAKHMTWHTKPYEDGTMAHPAHGEAWKHFDRTHESFASDSRNVRIGLCTDGFAPFNNFGTPYSCWPVIITVYNLPPWMCMNKSYMFLSMVIPSPKIPGKNIDVFLRPLIDELKMLWDDGVQTYDVSRKENFQMKATLVWTISDFPAYAMLFGWSTHGKLACPYCMELTQSFQLKFGRKASWFGCHRQFLPLRHRLRRLDKHFIKGKKEKGKLPPRLSGEEIRRRVEQLSNITFGIHSGKQEIDGFEVSHNWVKKSIFWELPYWHTNLLRHNLDVMHIEKNFFDNIFNTVMDVKGKTKDKAKARQDLELYCDRSDLHVISDNKGKSWKPKAAYALKRSK